MFSRKPKSKFIIPRELEPYVMFLSGRRAGATMFSKRVIADIFEEEYDDYLEIEYRKQCIWDTKTFMIEFLDVDNSFYDSFSKFGEPRELFSFKSDWAIRNKYLDVVVVFFSITNEESWSTAQDLVKMVDSIFSDGPLVTTTLSDSSKYNWGECGYSTTITKQKIRTDYPPCSFDFSTLEWIQQKRHRPPILIVATHHDLDQERSVLPLDVRQFVNAFQCDFIEISSKTKYNLQQAFDKILELYFLNQQALFDEQNRTPSLLSKLKTVLSTSTTTTSSSGASTSTTTLTSTYTSSTPPPKSKDGKS